MFAVECWVAKNTVAIQFPPTLVNKSQREIVEELLRIRFGVHEVQWTASPKVQDFTVVSFAEGLDPQEIYRTAWEACPDGCLDD